MKKDPEQLFWEKVDKSGECWIWTAAKNCKGYGRVRIHGQEILAHRASWQFSNGAIPLGMDLDHICHTRLCVHPGHLRVATRKQNSENLSVVRSSSGIRNVYWAKRDKKWEVRVGHNGRLYSGGHYSNLDEAAAAAKSLRNELFTHNDIDKKAA
jgi:hypothetical protein